MSRIHYFHLFRRKNMASVFQELANSLTSFEALTRVWFLPASALPEQLKGDLKGIKDYALSATETIKMTFTGEVEIYRGTPQTNSATGAEQLPMWLVRMEEYGYVRQFDTTFRLSGQAGTPSLGFTNQKIPGFDTPASAKLLLNLQIDAVQGPLKGIVTDAKCTTKSVEADIPQFPFTNANTFFTHVGDQALLVGEGANPIGYIVHGVMTPMLPTELKSGSPGTLSAMQLSNFSGTGFDLNAFNALSQGDLDFLNGIRRWP
jgi:hypothetical protein